MEGHIAQPGLPAIFQPLVVAKDLVDGIAGIPLRCEPPLSKYMAAENQEDVRVLGDQLLPHSLPQVSVNRVAAPGAFVLSVKVAVGENDDSGVLMLAGYGSSPGKDLVARFEFERQDEKVHFRGGKNPVRVVETLARGSAEMFKVLVFGSGEELVEPCFSVVRGRVAVS